MPTFIDHRRGGGEEYQGLAGGAPEKVRKGGHRWASVDIPAGPGGHRVGTRWASGGQPVGTRWAAGGPPLHPVAGADDDK